MSSLIICSKYPIRKVRDTMDMMNVMYLDMG